MTQALDTEHRRLRATALGPARPGRTAARVALLALGIAACLLAAHAAPPSPLDYADQAHWKGVLDHAQSPIDIHPAEAIAPDPVEPAQIVLDHSRTPFEAEDNGHAVEVATHGTDAMIRGRHFTLAQFHFHAASEHTIDGKSFPLEGHFVFKAQDGRLAVVGVMYQEGGTNQEIDAVLKTLDDRPHASRKDVDIENLLPTRRGYYHYLGSLTTPPLTENVEWYVMPAPVTMSKAQIAQFVQHYRRNNRDRQPMNNRPLVHYAGAS